MHLSASTLRLLPPFFIALLLSSAQALPRDVAKQQRLAEYAAQTPLVGNPFGASSSTVRAFQGTCLASIRSKDMPHASTR